MAANTPLPSVPLLPDPGPRGWRVTAPVRWNAPPTRRAALMLAWLLPMLFANATVAAAGEGLQWHDGDGAWTTQFALETGVEFRIRGLVAEVVVTQRFVNQSSQWREGRYLLPLPDDAAVGSLLLRIGERLVEGEVQETQRAREAYEQAASEGRGAAIVERSRPNLFRTAVANVAPGEVVEVEIGYWQPVAFTDGEFSITLPLTLTPRYQSPAHCGADCGPHPQALPASAAHRLDSLGDAPIVELRAEIDAGIELARVFSPTHAVVVTPEADRHRVELSRLVEMSDREFELRWQPAPSDQPREALFVESREDGHYLQVMLVPPTLPVAPMPREMVLVIDHSGSMHGEAMAQAIAALDDALTRLRADDRFNVIRFNHSAHRLFPEAVPANLANVQAARRFVGRLRANGGTELQRALEIAFEGAPEPGHLRQVVLATDAAIANERTLFTLIEHGRGEARLFPVGIGNAPNGHFLRRAAQLGRGTATTIRDTAGVANAMGRLFHRLDRPTMRDIDLDWPDLADAYPDPLPDLYAGEPLRISARVPTLDGMLEVRGRTPDGTWARSLALGSARPAEGPARLWASARIQTLEDALRNGADEERVRPEMLATALKHQLASRYTSLVAVERTPSRPIDAAMDSTAFANAAPAGSLAFAHGSTGLDRRLGLALTLGLVGAALWRRSA